MQQNISRITKPAYKKNSYQHIHNQNSRDYQQKNTSIKTNETNETNETVKKSFEAIRNGITILGNVLSNISFCDKQCSNINDNKVKNAIVNYLDNKYTIQIISRGYNVINPQNLRIVSNHQHILTPMTNGNPYLLYLTKIDGINCCIYIDRKLKDGYTYPKMHCVKYNFSDELFEKETVFSGELVKDNERRWVFILDNILIYKGILTNEKIVISRFELIHNILNKEYTLDKFIEICPIQVKRLFLYNQIEEMINDFIPYLSYICKGIIFYTLNNTCSNFAYILPRESQFEVKTPNEIDEIVQLKYPKLWAKKNGIMQDTNRPDSIMTIDVSCKAIDNNSESNNSESSNSESSNCILPNHAVFKILKTDIPDIYNLYYSENNTGGIVKYGIALVPNIKISHLLYNTFKSNPNDLNMRVECQFSKVFNKWTPIRFVNNEPYTLTNIESLEHKLQNE